MQELMLCFHGVLKKPSFFAHERSVQKFASYSVLFKIQNWLAFLLSSDMHLRFYFFLCSHLLLKFFLPFVRITLHCYHYDVQTTICFHIFISSHHSQVARLCLVLHILSFFQRLCMPFKHGTHERTSSPHATHNKLRVLLTVFFSVMKNVMFSCS